MPWRPEWDKGEGGFKGQQNAVGTDGKARMD